MEFGSEDRSAGCGGGCGGCGRLAAGRRFLLAKEVAEGPVDVAAALLQHFDNGAAVVLASQTLLDCGDFPGCGHLHDGSGLVGLGLESVLGDIGHARVRPLAVTHGGVVVEVLLMSEGFTPVEAEMENTYMEGNV